MFLSFGEIISFENGVRLLWLNSGVWSLLLTDQPYIQIAMFGNPYDLGQKLYLPSGTVHNIWNRIEQHF